MKCLLQLKVCKYAVAMVPSRRHCRKKITVPSRRYCSFKATVPSVVAVNEHLIKILAIYLRQ